MDEGVSLVTAPRICVMIREDSGYGFNLHGEKGVVGQYISALDAGGAAEISGLFVGDRVIEVNGINVEAMSHSEVVTCIRGDPNQATLLVVDKITDNYLKKISRPVTPSMASYASVHQMVMMEEEAKRLNDLNIIDATDAGYADQIEDEQNIAQVDSDPTMSNENTAIAKEHAPLPVREDTPPPPREDTPPMPREDTPSTPREHTPPPPREHSPPPPREHSPPPPREHTPPPPCEDTPPPAREVTPPPPREPTPPLPTSSKSVQSSQGDHESEPPSIRTSPPAQEPLPSPSKEDSPRKLSKKEALKKILSKPPKRKEVKETHTDWKTKLNEFNNL